MATNSRSKQIRKKLIEHSRKIFEERNRSQSGTGTLVAPISPTPREIISAVLSELDKIYPLHSSATMVDLGCGDGRWPIEFTARGSSRRAFGYDLDVDRLETGRAEAKARGLSGRVSLTAGDIFSLPDGGGGVVEDADLIVIYLFREAIRRLCGKFRPHQTVISVGFALPSPQWVPAWRKTVGGIHVYVYRCHDGSGPASKLEDGRRHLKEEDGNLASTA